LFLLHELHFGNLHFEQTWPVFLVVLGLIHLGSALASRDAQDRLAPASGKSARAILGPAGNAPSNKTAAK
jgi:hypothetical protein